jgi:catechol 2,3-dioxygenase-like lactoylglutathione lyase family enzyme
MLTNAHFTAMLPVTDLSRARRFYEEKLGLHPQRTLPNGEVVFETDGGTFALYPREKPPLSDHTALSWEVDDVAREVRSLRERGVRFEDYPEMNTHEGIAELRGERCAWFRDPDGNILCIHDTNGAH